MPGAAQSMVDELAPNESYRVLAELPDAVLVDVRTKAEWAFVGMPDLSGLGRQVLTIEWASFPAMAQNMRFFDALEGAAGGALSDRLLFICRSGARSMSAAQLVAAEAESRGLAVHCTNVAKGSRGTWTKRGTAEAGTGGKPTACLGGRIDRRRDWGIDA